MLCCECKHRVHPGNDKTKMACHAFPEKEFLVDLDAGGFFEKKDNEWHKITECEKRKKRKPFKIARASRGRFGE